MSSQATLVNPTQPRSPAPAHREQEDVIPPLKRQRTHARPIVLLDAPRGRSRNQPVVQQAKDEEPMDEPDEEAQSQPMGQTNEDALEVEVILGASLENNGRVSPGAASDVEVMDSEDERARKKLSLGHLRRSVRSDAFCVADPSTVPEHGGIDVCQGQGSGEQGTSGWDACERTEEGEGERCTRGVAEIAVSGKRL